MSNKETPGLFLMYLSEGVLTYLPANRNDDVLRDRFSKEIIENSENQTLTDALFNNPTGQPSAILTLLNKAEVPDDLPSLIFKGARESINFSFGAIHAWYFNERFNKDSEISINNDGIDLLTLSGSVNISPTGINELSSIIKMPLLKPVKKPDKNYQIGVPGLGLLNFQIGIGVDQWVILPSETIATSSDPLYKAKLVNAGKWIVDSVMNGIKLDFFLANHLNRLSGVAFYEITKQGLVLLCVTSDGYLHSSTSPEAIAACLTLETGPFRHLAEKFENGIKLSASGPDGVKLSISLDNENNLISTAETKVVGGLLLF